MNDILTLIEYFGNKINSQIITDILTEVEVSDAKKKLRLNQYKQEQGSLEVDKKTGLESCSVNNVLKNDYRGYIVNLHTGYFMGKPITYSCDDDKLNELLQDLFKKNHITSLDKETSRLCGIAGNCYRLYYFDKETQLKIKLIKPYEMIIIYDEEGKLPKYAMRYYKVTKVKLKNGGGVEEQKLWRIKWYDDTTITTYIQKQPNKNEYIEDPDYPPEPHFFSVVPVVEFKNNEFGLGDAQKVETLIDGYDNLESLNQDEIEEHRRAILYLFGLKLSPEQKKDLRKIGLVQHPNTDSKVGFITKNLNGDFNELQKKTLEYNIMKFSQTVDFYEQKFADSTGEARKWKLLSMELVAGDKESEFRKALEGQNEIIMSGWEQTLEYTGEATAENIEFEFHRNLPMDILYYADIITKLKGNISTEKILEIIPFIHDVQEEIKRQEDEGIYSEPIPFEPLQGNSEQQ